MIRFLTCVLLACSSVSSFAQTLFWTTDCTDKNFCYNNGSCGQGAVFMVEKAFTYCGNGNINYSYRIDLDNNGSIDVNSSLDTVSGNFPTGTHKVLWRATDYCGNAVNCSYLFTIKDCSPPNLLCINGLTQTIERPLCDAHFLANQFILSMSDNCTPTSQLEIGLKRSGDGTGFPVSDSLVFYNCDAGFNQVEVWVRDKNGLINKCSNYVLVQLADPECECNPDGDIKINGCITTVDNQIVTNHKRRLRFYSTAGVQPPVDIPDIDVSSDSCYSYSFGTIPFGGSYQIELAAEKAGPPLNGVTTYDLVLMSRHILGIEALDDAYQMEAADVNNSNSLTTLDIVETRKLILGLHDTFPGVPSWRVVRPLPNPANLGSYAALKDTYLFVFNNIQKDYKNLQGSFVAIKYGDLNHSVSGFAAPPDDRSALLLTADDVILAAGEETDITFRLSEDTDLKGWQIDLTCDPALAEIVGASGITAENYHIGAGTLRALWFSANTRNFRKGDELFTVRIKPRNAVPASAVFRLGQTGIPSEAYRPGVSNRSAIALHFGNKNTGNIVFLGVSPNPFTSSAVFELMMKDGGEANLDLFTSDGKLVYSSVHVLTEGKQRIMLEGDVLPSGRFFFFRLKAGEQVFSGKLARG
ncbi:MAG: hypothetical protein ACK5Q2_01370 [Bacteroidota bacterium]